MIEQDVSVVFNRQVAHETFLLGLQSSEMIADARPGQFVMIRVRPGIDPLLRRPFSICGTREDNTFLVLYKTVGRGTTMLSEAKKGQRLLTLGPLGTGFELPEGNGEPLLVSGGIGVAPLLFLAQALKAGNTIFMVGYRSAPEVVPMSEFDLDSIRLVISTDDGTAGYHGPVTEVLENHLTNSTTEKPTVFMCGPSPMLKKVSDMAMARNLPCQVSLEQNMACGLGACQGCAVSASAQANRSYLHVCTDGPVFWIESLNWEDL